MNGNGHHNQDQFQILLDAFKDYLNASPYFDILFSQKKGYFFLRLAKDTFEYIAGNT